MFEELQIDNKIALFIEKYGYFKFKKEETFNMRNVLCFIDDSDGASATKESKKINNHS